MGEEIQFNILNNLNEHFSLYYPGVEENIKNEIFNKLNKSFKELKKGQNILFLCCETILKEFNNTYVVECPNYYIHYIISDLDINKVIEVNKELI